MMAHRVLGVCCGTENVRDCGVLVYLHALERKRSAALAKKVLEILDADRQVAGMVDEMVPGVRRRLQERPTDALQDLWSLRVLFQLVEYVDPRAMERLRGFARDMVQQHARVFGSSDVVSEDVMSMLPESPLWASLVRYLFFIILTACIVCTTAPFIHSFIYLYVRVQRWQAVECILEQPVVEMVSSLQDSSSLKLTCSSKSSQGLPMSVSMCVAVQDSTGDVKAALKDQLGQYFGKPMTDISTSIWSGVRLQRDSISGRVECRDIDGEPVSIEFDREGYESMVLGLTFVTSHGEQPTSSFWSSLLNKRYSMWLPVDSHIQWRELVLENDVRYQVCVSGGQATTLDTASVEGILECIDAISQIDSSFSLPPPTFSIH